MVERKADVPGDEVEGEVQDMATETIPSRSLAPSRRRRKVVAATPGGPGRPDASFKGHAGGLARSLLADVLPALQARHGLAAGRDAATDGSDTNGAGNGAVANGAVAKGSATRRGVGGRGVGDAGNASASTSPSAPVRIPERPRSPEAWPHDAERLDAALLAADRAAWDREIDAMARAFEAGALHRRALREGVVAAAAARLGSAWVEDGASFVDVTIGTARLMEALDRLPGRARDGTGARVVLAPIPGDGHVLGLSLLAETLREGGFAVEVMARPSAAAVGRAVAGPAGRPEARVLGIGVPVGRHAGRAAMLVRAVRAAMRDGAMPLIVAGGGAARECEAMLRAAGVDEVMMGAGDPARWLDERLRARAAGNGEAVGHGVGRGEAVGHGETDAASAPPHPASFPRTVGAWNDGTAT